MGNEKHSLARRAAEWAEQFLGSLDAGGLQAQAISALAEHVKDRAYRLLGWDSVETGPQNLALETIVQEEIRIDRIPREWTTNVVGDLHGSLDAFKGNLLAFDPAIVKEGEDGLLHWIGGDNRLIFLGDILADRAGQGFGILRQIRRLRVEAQAEGGDIQVVCGNHDDFMLSYLTGVIEAGTDTFSPNNFAYYYALKIDSRDELEKYMPATLLAKLRKFDIFGDSDPLNELEKCRPEVLENLYSSPEGREMLEEMANFELFIVEGNTLYVHTNPTCEMMEVICKPDFSFDETRAFFKYYTRKRLAGESVSGLETHRFRVLKDTFLNTDNRSSFQSSPNSHKIGSNLKKKGILIINHGHSYVKIDDRRLEAIGLLNTGIEVKCLDTGYGHPQLLGKQSPAIETHPKEPPNTLPALPHRPL